MGSTIQHGPNAILIGTLWALFLEGILTDDTIFRDIVEFLTDANDHVPEAYRKILTDFVELLN